MRGGIENAAAETLGAAGSLEVLEQVVATRRLQSNVHEVSISLILARTESVDNHC